jgi:hypothetical protein
MFQGLSQASQSMSQFFMNQANQTKPLIRVAAGTPIGFFFVASATDQQNSQSGNAGYFSGGYGQPGYPGYGQAQPGYGYPQNGAMPAGYNGYNPGLPGYNGQMQQGYAPNQTNPSMYNTTAPYNTSIAPVSANPYYSTIPGGVTSTPIGTSAIGH